MPAYWLVFAVIAARQGKYPGYVHEPWNSPYQWESVIFVWFVLAVEVFVLHKIIDPLNYKVSSPRFDNAFGFSFVLLFLNSFFFVTDLPPVLDLPVTFALVTAVLMLVCAAAETIVLEVRRRAARK